MENPSTYNSTTLNSAHFKCCTLFSIDVRGEKSVTSSRLCRKFNALWCALIRNYYSRLEKQDLPSGETTASYIFAYG